MNGRAPSWWYGRGSIMPVLLAPLSLAWTAASALRGALARPYRSELPVICIGNPTAGGGGKTPAAIAVAKLLMELGERPVFLSRGHGGARRGPHLVTPGTDSAAQVGDEPLLLARAAPTVISIRRDAGARLAEELEASVIVMDDGFQNPQLCKDLSILAVDRETGIGNGMVIPAGPLRAPLMGQLEKAQALLLTGEGPRQPAILAQAQRKGLSILEARLAPGAKSPSLKNQRVIAFAGIARPQKFFDSVARAGASLVECIAFPDHHAFTRADCERLLAAAAQNKAALVTTEKDHVRIVDKQLARAAKAIPVALEFADEKAMRDLLKSALKGFRQRRAVSRPS